MKKDFEHLINEMGGHRRLAYELGLTDRAVLFWTKRGIPVKYWKRILYAYPKLSLARLAKAHV